MGLARPTRVARENGSDPVDDESSHTCGEDIERDDAGVIGKALRPAAHPVPGEEPDTGGQKRNGKQPQQAPEDATDMVPEGFADADPLGTSFHSADGAGPCHHLVRDGGEAAVLVAPRIADGRDETISNHALLIAQALDGFAPRGPQGVGHHGGPGDCQCNQTGAHKITWIEPDAVGKALQPV